MSSRQQPRVQVGDTLAVPIEDGRFGAVRVIRTCEETGSSLVVITPYMGGIPKSTDRSLRSVLIERRGFYRGAPAIFWYEGSPAPDFVHVAVIPPTEEERAYDAHGASGGGMGPFYGPPRGA